MNTEKNQITDKGFDELYFVYAKHKGQKQFQAFDINEGRPVGNLIYATLVENSIENQMKLQEVATANSEINLVIQLRDRHGKTVFQTH